MRIKMTTKRQATFPKRLCEEMRLEPGHAIQVKPAMLDGQRVWVLSPSLEPPAMSWVGALRRYSGAETPSMTTVRTRIKEAMACGELD